MQDVRLVHHSSHVRKREDNVSERTGFFLFSDPRACALDDLE